MIIYKNKNIVIPIGLGPNFNDDTVEIKNENKSVTITENGTEIITYDPAEYTGLGIVQVNTNVHEAHIQPFATVNITDNGETTVLPEEDYEGIARVDISVNVQPELEAKTVDSSTNEQVVTTDKYGLSSVTVNPYVLDEKTVDSSTNAQVITSDEDGLRQVTINPYVLNSLEVDSSTANQEYTGQFGTVTVNKYELDEKTVDPSTNTQVVTSSKDGLSEVTVNRVTSSIDSNILAGNIKEGVTILGVQGTFEGGTLQSKTVDSSTVEQTIEPDSGNYGLSSVTVEPYTLDSSSAVLKQNGEYVFTSGQDGLSRVDVSVNIDTQSYYDSGYSDGEAAGIAEQKAKLDSSTFTSNGTFTREDGWDEITVDVDTVNNQQKTVDSSTSTQVVTYDNGYTGLSSVMVNPYTVTPRTVNPSTETQVILPEAYISDPYIQKPAGNTYFALYTPSINDRIEIDYYTTDGKFNFGCGKGAYEGIGMQANTFGPSFGNGTAIVYQPSTGRHVVSLAKDAIIVDGVYTANDATEIISETLYALAYKYKGVSAPYYTKTGDRIYYIKVWTNDVLAHYWVPVYDNDVYKLYDKVTDTYVSPTGVAVMGSEGTLLKYDGLSSVTVNAVTNSIDYRIQPGNIKNGVTILGVQGNYSGTSINNQDKTVDSSTNSQTVSSDAGYTGLGTVTINPYTLDSSSAVIEQNGEYVFTSGQDGLSRVDVSVNIDTQAYYDSGYSAGETAGIAEGIAEQKAKLDSSTFTENGTYTREDGWNEITVQIDEVNNQNKTVDSSTNSQSVTYDSGYTGLGTVTVNPYTLESKTVDASTSTIVVKPTQEDGYIELASNGAYFTGAIASLNMEIEVDFYGTAGYNNRCTFSFGSEDDSGRGISITQGDVQFGNASYGASTQILGTGRHLVKMNKDYVSIDGTVINATTPATTVFTGKPLGIFARYDDDDEDYEYAYAGQKLYYMKIWQNNVLTHHYVPKYYNSAWTIYDNVTSSYLTKYGTGTLTGGGSALNDGLSQVTVNAVTSSIDSNIKAGNIKSGVNILGVQGTYTGGTLQTKTVDSSTNSQVITPDDGNYGIGQITVNPYVLDSSSAVLKQNGEYVFTSGVDGLSRVDVSVNIDTQSYYDSGYSAGEADQKAKLDSSTLTQNGTYTREDGWNEITVDVDTVNNQNKTVDSSTVSQLVQADHGYTGLGQVTVNPYTLDSSSATITENGDYVFTSGVDGLSRVDVSVNIDTSTYYNNGYAAGETAGIAEGIAQQKSLLDSSTFTANATYTRADGWNEITVAVPAPSFNTQSKNVDSSTNSQEVEPDSGYDGLSKVTVNPYVLDSSTVDPSTNQITVTSAEDGLSSVTVNAVTSSIDANIAAGNIKDGVTILGVQGTYTGTVINNQNKSIDSSTNSQSVTYDSGYTGLGTVTVNPYTAEAKTVDASTNTIIVTPTHESYIETTGNSTYFYGATAALDMEIEVDFYGSTNGMFCFGSEDESAKGTSILNGRVQFGNASYPNSMPRLTAGRHLVKMTKDYVSINGTTYNATTPATTVFTDEPLGIFARYDDDDGEYEYAYAGQKLYYMKIWQNNVLTHHYVPKYDSGEWKIYDNVTSTYLTREGSASNLSGLESNYDALSQVTVTGLNLDTIYNTLAAY